MSEILDVLLSAKAPNTSLITYYIPANYSISSLKSHITGELATTSNIKNKQVGKSVQHSLLKIQSLIKDWVSAPDSGCVICAGSEPYV